jgi:hypothetical protein
MRDAANSITVPGVWTVVRAIRESYSNRIVGHDNDIVSAKTSHARGAQITARPVLWGQPESLLIMPFAALPIDPSVRKSPIYIEGDGLCGQLAVLLKNLNCLCEERSDEAISR